MSQQVEGNTRTFTSSGTVTAHTLVKLSAAETVATAGLAETPIGVARQTVATGKPVTVHLLSKAGTVKIKTAAAVAVGAKVYGRASGLVDDVSTSSAVQIGVALEAATAAGDYIEVMPLSA